MAPSLIPVAYPRLTMMRLLQLGLWALPALAKPPPPHLFMVLIDECAARSPTPPCQQ